MSQQTGSVGGCPQAVAESESLAFCLRALGCGEGDAVLKEEHERAEGRRHRHDGVELSVNQKTHAHIYIYGLAHKQQAYDIPLSRYGCTNSPQMYRCIDFVSHINALCVCVCVCACACLLAVCIRSYILEGSSCRRVAPAVLLCERSAVRATVACVSEQQSDVRRYYCRHRPIGPSSATYALLTRA